MVKFSDKFKVFYSYFDRSTYYNRLSNSLVKSQKDSKEFKIALDKKLDNYPSYDSKYQFLNSIDKVLRDFVKENESDLQANKRKRFIIPLIFLLPVLALGLFPFWVGFSALWLFFNGKKLTKLSKRSANALKRLEVINKEILNLRDIVPVEKEVPVTSKSIKTKHMDRRIIDFMPNNIMVVLDSISDLFQTVSDKNDEEFLKDFSSFKLLQADLVNFVSSISESHSFYSNIYQEDNNQTILNIFNVLKDIEEVFLDEIKLEKAIDRPSNSSRDVWSRYIKLAKGKLEESLATLKDFQHKADSTLLNLLDIELVANSDFDTSSKDISSLNSSYPFVETSTKSIPSSSLVKLPLRETLEVSEKILYK